MRFSITALLLAAATLPALAWDEDCGCTQGTCTKSEFSWSTKDGHDVCQQAKLLLQCCDSGATVEPLSKTGGSYYSPPTGDDATSCACSAVVYNLLSACAACQSDATCNGWPTWSEWTASCSSVSISFPHSYPDDYTPPDWALFNPNHTGDGTFSFGLSYAIALTYVDIDEDINVPSANSTAGRSKSLQDRLDDCRHDLGIWFPVAIAFMAFSGLLLIALAALFFLTRKKDTQVNQTLVTGYYPPSVYGSRPGTPVATDGWPQTYVQPQSGAQWPSWFQGPKY